MAFKKSVERVNLSLFHAVSPVCHLLSTQFYTTEFSTQNRIKLKKPLSKLLTCLDFPIYSSAADLFAFLIHKTDKTFLIKELFFRNHVN